MDVMAVTLSARNTSIIVPRMSTSRGVSDCAMLEDPAHRSLSAGRKRGVPSQRGGRHYTEMEVPYSFPEAVFAGLRDVG